MKTTIPDGTDLIQVVEWMNQRLAVVMLIDGNSTRATVFMHVGKGKIIKDPKSLDLWYANHLVADPESVGNKTNFYQAWLKSLKRLTLKGVHKEPFVYRELCEIWSIPIPEAIQQYCQQVESRERQNRRWCEEYGVACFDN